LQSDICIFRKKNSIYADEVLTDMELPTGRLLFEEETEEAADEDYESIEESDIAEQSLLRTADSSDPIVVDALWNQ
jgi:hypothetical protein